MRLQPTLTSLLFSAAVFGCVADEADVELDEIEQAVTCPTPALNTMRSLAVTDPTILAKFSFQRVMSAINTSARGTSTPLALYRDWMATWSQCSNPAVDPNKYGVGCPRVETQFGTLNPFATTGPRFVPVALMNRFDLAPTSGADCGEYRIVYALTGSPDDRAFIIFEARLPNPNPAAGLNGCAGVADFWARLSSVSDVAVRATRLERFYFTGIAAEGLTFSPVVTATNYGLAATGTATGKGQIRTNFFADFTEWHLREFKLTKPCALGDACKLAVAHVTAKTNPADELFRGTHSNTAAFEASFLNQIPALSRSNPARIGMATNNQHNEFESSAQATNVVYRGFTRSSFRTQIAGRITNPALTVANILDRATTQTCGGCHQHSNGVDLGNNVRWPSSLGFVHVDEQRTLSPALRDVFLPRRASVLKSFLDRQCAGIQTADDGRTLSGAEVGAAN
ncbi:MAG: hypothetical protein H0T89_02135 [Deltaproteobacteria bacterium]|nr:hypothetical protein [Deltaproteobacteria bacterium]